MGFALLNLVLTKTDVGLSTPSRSWPYCKVALISEKRNLNNIYITHNIDELLTGPRRLKGINENRPGYHSVS